MMMKLWRHKARQKKEIPPRDLYVPHTSQLNMFLAIFEVILARGKWPVAIETISTAHQQRIDHSVQIIFLSGKIFGR